MPTAFACPGGTSEDSGMTGYQAVVGPWTVFPPDFRPVALSEVTDGAGATLAVVEDELHPYVCYAGKANSFVIRADGGVAKCTVALYDERNRVGKLNEDGTIALDRLRLMPWLKGLETLDLDTLACPYQTLTRTETVQAPP